MQILCIGIQSKEIGDVKGFSTAGWTLKNGMDFYQIDKDHNQYPFLPLLLPFYVIFNILSEQFSFFTFSFYLKLFLLIPSLYLLSYLIFFDLKRKSAQYARLGQLLFLTSPITYSIILFHGQIDVILLLLFYFGSKLILSHHRSKNIVGAIAYGLSISAKTWSMLFLPVLLKYIKPRSQLFVFLPGVVLTIFLVIFIYSQFVFRPKLDSIFQAVINAGGPVGIWGLPLITSFSPTLLSWFIHNKLILFGVLFLAFQIIILRKNISFFQSCFLTVLGMYIIIPNWGIQYLLWITPFLYIVKPSLKTLQINIFIVLSSVYLFMNYLNIATEKITVPHVLVYSFGFVLWLFITYWFIYLVKTLQKSEVS